MSLPPEVELEVQRRVNEELVRLLAPARADDSLRGRLERASERDREVLRRLGGPPLQGGKAIRFE